MENELKQLAELRKEIERLTDEKDKVEVEYKATSSYQNYLVYAETIKSLQQQATAIAKKYLWGIGSVG